MEQAPELHDNQPDEDGGDAEDVEKETEQDIPPHNPDAIPDPPNGDDPFANMPEDTDPPLIQPQPKKKKCRTRGTDATETPQNLHGKRS